MSSSLRLFRDFCGLDASRTTGFVPLRRCSRADAEPTGRRLDITKTAFERKPLLLAIVPIIVLVLDSLPRVAAAGLDLFRFRYGRFARALKKPHASSKRGTEGIFLDRNGNDP